MLGEKVFISKHGKQSLLNVVMKIIINKYIIQVFRETNFRETNIRFSYLLQQYKIKYSNKQKFL